MTVDSPNSLNNGSPKQANQTDGKGFFTAPDREADGRLTRERSDTLADHWSQPRLFFNSLTEVEQQLLIDAIRFETSDLDSDDVKSNVLTQLNKISNDIANRVADFLGMSHLEPDETYYHHNTTSGVSIMANPLPSIKGLKIGILATTAVNGSIAGAESFKAALKEEGIVASVIGETLVDGVDVTYTHAHASDFDGVIVANGAEDVLERTITTAYPLGRPMQIITDAYRWGKPIGGLGSGGDALQQAGIRRVKKREGEGSKDDEGVYYGGHYDDGEFVDALKKGLATFKFVDRFPTDGEGVGAISVGGGS